MNLLDSYIEILSSTPRTVRSLLEDLSNNWMTGATKENWGPIEVLGHWIHGERTDWIPRLQIMISNDSKRTFTPFDRLAQFDFIKGMSVDKLLELFEELRTNNLELLNSFDIEKYIDRKGIHPDLGEVTVHQLLATWVAHDLSHISQITRFLAMKLQDEVGPWKEYLSILE